VIFDVALQLGNAMDMKKNIFEQAEIWDWVADNESNNERFSFTEKLTPSDVNTIIDIGCGSGGFLKLLHSARNLERFVAVDTSEEALKRIPFEKVKANITQVPYPDREFDCVYALEVLEHLNVPDFETALSELARLSKKYIIVSVPYREDIAGNMTKCVNCSTIFHPDGHLHNFDEEKMMRLFNEHNFVQQEVHRLGWSELFRYHKQYRNFFYSAAKYRNIHYTICPACGHELLPSTTVGVKSQASGSPFAAIKRVLKSIWPKEKKSYWIIALYEKN
jgi:ubiquinone/menaquinone biosynthesis C-methylase UbiE